MGCLESKSDALKQDTTSVNLKNLPGFTTGTHAASKHFAMITTLLLSAGVIFLSGMIAELFVIATAPAGYQDESGFHLGTQFPEAPAAPLGEPDLIHWRSQFQPDQLQFVSLDRKI